MSQKEQAVSPEFIASLKSGWWAHRTIFPHTATPEFAAEKRADYEKLFKQYGIRLVDVIAEGAPADISSDPNFKPWTLETTP